MLDANVFRQLGGGFRQRDQWIRKGSLEEGERIATVLNCPNINKLVDWREQVSRCVGIERGFAGKWWSHLNGGYLENNGTLR